MEFGSHLRTDDDGILRIEGLSTVELADQYGTPLFVLSENTIRENYRRIYNAFAEGYPNEVIVCVGMKGNRGLAARRVIVDEGGGGDAFGLGELTVALMAGSSPERIVMNGPNKSDETLVAAIDAGIMINVDNLDELDNVKRLAASLGKTARISVRIRLPLKAVQDVLFTDTRYPPPGISPSKWEQEFKFGMEPESLFKAIERALSVKQVALLGVMYHGGIPRRAGFFREETEELMDYVGEVRDRFSWVPQYLNVGGGFVPNRVGADIPPDIEEYAETIVRAITSKCGKLDLPVPKLLMEPGRYCWENAGVWLTRVGNIKEDRTLARMTWVYVDGNTNEMNDPFDPRSGVHHVVLANDGRRPGNMVIDICGQLCNAADVLAKARTMPPLKSGDILAFLDMGAYNEGFADQSNATPRSATVMVSKGRTAVVRRRETVQDVLAREAVPTWLAVR